MQAQYEITADDYVAFNLNYMKNDPKAQKRLMLSQIAGAALILIAGGVFCFLRGSFSLLAMGVFVVAALLYALYIPWSVKGSVKKSVQRVLKNSAKSACGDKTLSIEAEKLHLNGSGEDSYYEYGSIVHLITDEKHYFIYTGALEALILPFRAFSTEAERNEFYEALCDKVTEAGGSL